MPKTYTHYPAHAPRLVAYRHSSHALDLLALQRLVHDGRPGTCRRFGTEDGGAVEVARDSRHGAVYTFYTAAELVEMDYAGEEAR